MRLKTNGGGCLWMKKTSVSGTVK